MSWFYFLIKHYGN